MLKQRLLALFLLSSSHHHKNNAGNRKKSSFKKSGSHQGPSLKGPFWINILYSVNSEQNDYQKNKESALIIDNSGFLIIYLRKSQLLRNQKGGRPPGGRPPGPPPRGPKRPGPKRSALRSLGCSPFLKVLKR